MNPTNFLTELKRRNVYKVAVAYAVVAWLLIQAASILFPTFEAPPWVMKVFVAVIILGFPIALVFSWAFEITPEGIKRESEVEPGKSITRRTGRKLVAFTAVLAAVAATLFVFQLVRTRSTSSESTAALAIPNKSIAVLPFDNLSRDPDNAYFCEGMQDEILTRLAKIADLKVISRTSTQRYQSKPGNLPDIAKQLGVANILEGSVQKAGDTVRVSVNLIQAASDSHVWADTYDRKVTDIFGIESEIAKRIAESLQAKLTGREEQALAVKPTNNPEAYDAYLRGLAFEARGYSLAGGEASQQIAGFYERAVQLDPNFAVAWARLSRADASVDMAYGNAARRDAATRALENAQKLAPDSPETLLALGHYQYGVLSDYRAAKTTFARVSKMLPGGSEGPYALGLVARREGYWDQSIAYFEQALPLDPRNVELLMDAAETYSMVRQFSTALKLFDRALDIKPNDLDVMASKASIYQAQGNLQEAAKLLSQVTAHTPNDDTFSIKLTQLRLERNHTEVIRLLQERQAQVDSAPEFDKAANQVVTARAQLVAGDTAEAKAAAARARSTFEQLCREQPQNQLFAARLSEAYAVMGQKDSALEAAERAIMLLPRTRDAMNGGTRFEENLAVIETIFGENSRAVATLAPLLHTPYSSWVYDVAPITPALLRLDPLWDPLRSDPSFQKLCEEKQP